MYNARAMSLARMGTTGQKRKCWFPVSHATAVFDFWWWGCHPEKHRAASHHTGVSSTLTGMLWRWAQHPSSEVFAPRRHDGL